MSFAFDGECEKDAFITYCCLNYKVFDKRYQRCFKNYLLNIHPVNCFENRALPVCYIMDILFEKEICEFYGIYLILQDLPTLIGILEKLEFEDKFSFIGKCDFLFQNEKRKPYVHALRSEFEKAIMEFCADVSVNEYDVDINSLLDGYIYSKKMMVATSMAQDWPKK